MRVLGLGFRVYGHSTWMYRDIQLDMYVYRI